MSPTLEKPSSSSSTQKHWDRACQIRGVLEVGLKCHCWHTIYWYTVYIYIYIYWIYIIYIYIGYLDHPQYCVMPNIWGIWELFQMAPDCWDSRLPRIAISSTAGSFLFSCLRLRMFFRLGRRLMLQILGHRACPGWVLKSSVIKKYRWIKVLKYS